MNRNTQRHIARALLASADSSYARVNIGAVIAFGSRVVAVGCNSHKSHPMQQRFNTLSGRLAPRHACHAEMAAIIRAGTTSLVGAVLYVGRYDLNGSLAMCRPCVACMAAAKYRGIKETVYTTKRGVVHEMVL